MFAFFREATPAVTTRLGGVEKMRETVITMISAPVTVSQPSFKNKCSKVDPKKELVKNKL